MAVSTGLRVFALVFAMLGCVMLQQRAAGAAQGGSAGRPSASAAVKRTSAGAGKSAPEAAKQSPSDEAAETFPLRAVNIAGNEHFSTEDIIAVTGLTIGSRVRPSDFQRAMEKLHNSGSFETLEFRYGAQGDGYQVTFKVQEAPRTLCGDFSGAWRGRRTTACFTQGEDPTL